MPEWRALVLSGLLLGMSTPLLAQQPAPAFPRWQAAATSTVTLVLPEARPRTYGLVGLLTGLAVGAVAGGVAGNAMCHNFGTPGESCTPGIVGFAAIGAGLFGLIGYAIGREVHRGAPTAAPGTP